MRGIYRTLSGIVGNWHATSLDISLLLCEGDVGEFCFGRKLVTDGERHLEVWFWGFGLEVGIG